MTTPDRAADGAELLALADRIEQAPAYTADQIRCSFAHVDDPKHQVFLVNAPRRADVVAALRAAAQPPALQGEPKGALPFCALEWPILKKALWKVLMDENLNDGHYIKAFDLIEKLHNAALATPADTIALEREAVPNIHNEPCACQKGQCVAMVEDDSHCINRLPNASVADCSTCLAATWHSDGKCLRCARTASPQETGERK